MNASDLPALTTAVNTLLGTLVGRKMVLEDLQSLGNPTENERDQMFDLAIQIASLETRLQFAERLQDAALLSPS